MITKRTFRASKLVRATVAGLLSLALVLVAASPLFTPSYVSAQTAQEVSTVCNKDYLLAVSLGAKKADDEDIKACEVGYKGSGSGKTKAEACKAYAKDPKTNYFCETGWKFQQEQAKVGVALSESQLQDKAEAECKTGSAAEKSACRNGFREGFNNTKTKAATCGSERPTPYANDAEKAACEKGFVAGAKLLKDRGGFPLEEDKNQADCDAKWSSPLSWILCPIIDLGANLSDFVFTGIVSPLLKDVPVSTEKTDPSFVVWQQFRLLGNILLVGGLLAVVYSQTKGSK